MEEPFLPKRLAFTVCKTVWPDSCCKVRLQRHILERKFRLCHGSDFPSL